MKTVIIALTCLMLWGCDSPTSPASSRPVAQPDGQARYSGGEPLIDELLGQLKTGDKKTRIEAAKALGKLRDARTVPALVAALNDRRIVRIPGPTISFIDGTGSHCEPIESDVNAAPRAAAARALGQIASPTTVELLIVTTHDNELAVRIASAEALGNIGDKRAIKPLRKLLENPRDGRDAFAAAKALGEIGGPEAIEALRGCLLKSPHWVFRQFTIEALAREGSDEAVDAIAKALKDEHGDTRHKAIRALGKVGTARAVAALQNALKFVDADARAVIEEALQRTVSTTQPATATKMPATSADLAAKCPQIKLPDGFTIVWVIGSKDGRYLAVFGVPRDECKPGHRPHRRPQFPHPKPETWLFDATKNETTKLQVENGDVPDDVLTYITGFSPDGRKLLFSVFVFSRGTTYYVRDMESGRMQSILGPNPGLACWMGDKVVVVKLAGGKVLPAELYSADGKREKALNIHALIEGIDDAGKVLIVSVDKNDLAKPPFLTEGNDLRARLIINAEGKILRNLGPVRRTIRPKISPGGKYAAVMELNPDGSNQYWWKIHVYCADRKNDHTIDDRDACLIGVMDNGDVLVRTTNPRYLSSTNPAARSCICRLVQIDAKGRSRILVEDLHDAYLVGSKVYCLTTDNQGLKVADVVQPGSKADMPHPEIWRKYPHLKEKLDADLSRMETYLKSLEPEAFTAKHPELVKMARSDDALQRARAIKAISALRNKSALSIVVAATKKCNLSREGSQSLMLANLQPWLSLTDWVYDAYHPGRKTPKELAPLLPLFVKMLVEAGDKPDVRGCCLQAIGCLAGPEWLPLVKDLSPSRHPAITHWSDWAVKEIAKRAQPIAKPAKGSSP